MELNHQARLCRPFPDHLGSAPSIAQAGLAASATNIYRMKARPTSLQILRPKPGGPALAQFKTRRPAGLPGAQFVRGIEHQSSLKLPTAWW
jgi:hypothetical protein